MPTLEAQLTALTQEFVAKLVDALRNASFAEVAQLSTAHAPSQPPSRPREPRAPGRPPSAGVTRGRQTATTRAELGERVVGALRTVSQPIGVRDLSTQLGVAPDVLAVPLRELRAAGKIRKHGEKRSTTYSAA
jgi:DNA-binding transcriptional ArsR family regulator